MFCRHNTPFASHTRPKKSLNLFSLIFLSTKKDIQTCIHTQLARSYKKGEYHLQLVLKTQTSDPETSVSFDILKSPELLWQRCQVNALKGSSLFHLLMVLRIWIISRHLPLMSQGEEHEDSCQVI